ncbi:hypothetical protein DFH08DRAFT_969931 [Mycena albidolilacea]|uniref:Uncharacterized protein n=1 Tax=Mycena albidolilacea TaxID=1033008 RepID=A0AAD6ZGR0_9AGAR|nr:hypothetical protein DFH08DRAFT_969931 [Mycena albidolilacea]
MPFKSLLVQREPQQLDVFACAKPTLPATSAVSLKDNDADDAVRQREMCGGVYGCYTYAAAEGVCFHGIIYELVFAAVDAKTNWGFLNHIVKNILQGLNCAMTMAEVFALAVYGMSISWPSMNIGSSGRENPINPLDLTDIL